jgi:hypothetical protein
MSTGVTREEFLRRIGGKVNTLISLNEGNLNIEDDNIDIDEVDSVNNLVVNDKQVQTKRVNSAIEDDIEFKNKLTNDDELDEILNNSNLPSVVKEAYKKHKQPQLDVDFISETIGGQLTTQQIKEKYGKLMLSEGELNQNNKPINRLLNETLDKKTTLNGITLEDIRNVIREEMINYEGNNVVLRVGDTLTFKIGDKTYECSEIKLKSK